MKKFAFHLSLPCEDLEKTKRFYIDVLGAQLGRSTNTWLDVNLYGNQITFTKSGAFDFKFKDYRLGNDVIPSFHFGVIVDLDLWSKLYSYLFQSEYEITTEVLYFENKIGEHLSFFITDPNGFKVEFKSFKEQDEMFATETTWERFPE
ncbi:MAG: VOC family protein [Flavobacteriaceae bacterium]